MSEDTPDIRPAKSTLWRGILLALGVCVAVIALLCGVFVLSSRARMYTVQTTLRVLGAAPAQDAEGRTNILLLGVGDAHHDGADLTDTMMVASIDPLHTNSVVLLSLPRDLLLDVRQRRTQGRINAIYALEKYRLQAEGLTETGASIAAMQALAAEMETRLGIEMHGVLKADFTAFEEVVDAMGGVDVDVAESLIDYTYPLAEDRVGIFQIDTGPQHLDGKTALMYARSRHSTSDFDRSARQQQLLAAIAAKVRSMGKVEQLALARSLQERLRGHVETTLTAQQLLGLAQIAHELSLDRIIPVQINFQAGSDFMEAAAGGFVYPAPVEMFSGASVLLPIASAAGTNDWSQIRTFAHMLIEHRSLYLAHPVIAIINENARPVEAHRLRNELLRYGWEVLPVEYPDNESSQKRETSEVLYRGSIGKDAAPFFGQLLGMPSTTAAPEVGSGDVVILLGSGFKYQPIQMLSGAVLQNR